MRDGEGGRDGGNLEAMSVVRATKYTAKVSLSVSLVLSALGVSYYTARIPYCLGPPSSIPSSGLSLAASAC